MKSKPDKGINVMIYRNKTKSEEQLEMNHESGG